MTLARNKALAVALGACLTLASGRAPQAGPRPRDPWVFRGSVAGVERAVVLALHADLWVAYDAETCALRAAWNGRNGGEALAAQANARWLDGAAGRAWWLVREGRAQALEVAWRGYVFRGQQVTLRCELKLDDVRIAVEETPELVRPADLAEDPSSIAPWIARDMVGLRRTFRASGIPDGASLSLTLRDTLRGNLLSQDLVDPFEARAPEGGRRVVSARMPMRGAEAWGELIYFFGDASPREGR